MSLVLVLIGAVVGVVVLGLALGIPFGLPLALALGVGLVWFGIRAARVGAVADPTGIRIRNLFDDHEMSWPEVARISVDRRPGGGGWGITVARADSSAVAVEASWGPWYASRGPLARRNRARCEQLLERMAEYGPPTDTTDAAAE